MLILLVIYVVCSVNGHNDILTTLVGPCHRLPSGSFARDVEDCQNYFLCKNGHTIRGKCPDNLVFDAPNQRCEYPEDVTCFSCPKNEVYSLLPVERTCHQFYQCWMGIATIHSCPRSLVFDPKLRRCNFPIGTGCDGDEQVEEGCPAVDGSNPVYLRHATSCTAYYVCSKGTPLERQCAQGLHFNPRLRICDLPSEANCRIEGEVCSMGHEILGISTLLDLNLFTFRFFNSRIQRVVAVMKVVMVVEVVMVQT